MPGEALVIWTTTPWTLPANVAAAVRPAAQYGRLDNGDWLAVERGDGRTFAEVRPGSELVGWRYRGPFDDLRPGSEVDHRVIGWDEVSMQEGTGIVHIAPGCGTEDFELGRAHGLPVLTPVDESGRFYPEYGWLAGLTTSEARDRVIDAPAGALAAGERGRDDAPLSGVLAMPHSADLPGLRRLVHLRRPDQGADARGEPHG